MINHRGWLSARAATVAFGLFAVGLAAIALFLPEWVADAAQEVGFNLLLARLVIPVAAEVGFVRLVSRLAIHPVEWLLSPGRRPSRPADGPPV